MVRVDSGSFRVRWMEGWWGSWSFISSVGAGQSLGLLSSRRVGAMEYKYTAIERTNKSRNVRTVTHAAREVIHRLAPFQPYNVRLHGYLSSASSPLHGRPSISPQGRLPPSPLLTVKRCSWPCHFLPYRCRSSSIIAHRQHGSLSLLAPPDLRQERFRDSLRSHWRTIHPRLNSKRSLYKTRQRAKPTLLLHIVHRLSLPRKRHLEATTMRLQSQHSHSMSTKVQKTKTKTKRIISHRPRSQP